MKIIKSIYKDDEIYVNHNRLMSVQADISISQSIRNLGKSYDAMIKAKKKLDNGKSLVWARWDMRELNISKNELEKILIDAGGTYKAGKIKDSDINYIINSDNGATVYFCSVKNAMSYKGADFKNLDWLVYDEFIPEFYDIKTRKDTEFLKFMSLYVTLKRVNKNFKALLISNCIDWFNGYTKSWGILPFDSGQIRIYDKEEIFYYDDKPVKEKVRIAFENVKPSVAMVQRVIKEEMLKGNYENKKEYFNNVTTTEYNLLAECPNKKLPLETIQFRRGKNYYSYRIYNGKYYFVKCAKRNGFSVDVFSYDNIQTDEIRRPKLGVVFEEMLNQGLLRFDSGHTYNDIIFGIWDYRKRI